jgi:aminoglycoside phosphotransferase (APT) family kinase protein
VRDEEPLALVMTELAGRALEEVKVSSVQERDIWRGAGKVLTALHNLTAGEYFAQCQRDGTPAGRPVRDAKEYVAASLHDTEDRGIRGGCLGDTELAIIRLARTLLPSFDGERPIPCHRDYCPANWLVTDEGVLTGVIDFSSLTGTFAWLISPDFLTGIGSGGPTYWKPFWTATSVH